MSMAVIVGLIVMAAVWIWSSGTEEDEPMLNPSEWNTLIPIIVMLAAPYMAKLGISNDELSTLLGALGASAAAAYACYSAWNMKRVAETAIISGHAVDKETADKLSTKVEANTNQPAPARETPAQFNANPDNR